ncbi:hypothetical protein EG328_004121 [Venturia inaequalis]|uniref:Uncharacterized protein n=1 Tax=Venturia inaequalis TaxID=5025 RepID=A0A8H3VHG4_VENIN|nr:hypothetical protein EG328_004121 [Venturia inaequalis]
MPAPSTTRTIKSSEVILASARDWDDWFARYKANFSRSGIWKYANPVLPSDPILPSEPTPPTPYKATSQGQGMISIEESISAEYAGLLTDCTTVYQMLKALKKMITPTTRAREFEVLREY